MSSRNSAEAAEAAELATRAGADPTADMIAMVGRPATHS